MRINITVTAGPAQGKHFSFDEPDCFLFGRAADARVSLPNDPYVSRHHFLLEISPPHCKVTDLDSKNGLFVNNVRYGGRKPPGPGVKQAPDGAKETLLQEGDELAVGDTRMKVSIQLAALCAECGRAIPDDRKKACTFVGGTYLCGECRGRMVEKAKPKPKKRTILCTRCEKDITEEAGARGQASQAEYTCQDCRRKEAADPMGLLEGLLKAAMAPKAGSAGLSIEDYDIEKELGRGGMGAVFKAIQKSTGRTVAIKTMLPQVAMNEDSVRTFLREVEVTRQLKHPNIVELFDHGKTRGNFFFVLEFVDGMDLDKFIEARGGRLSLEEAAPIMIGILDGLAHAHQANLEVKVAGGGTKRFRGVVHRDLKPQNILLGRNEGGWIPKVADFGLSKSFEAAGLTDMTVPGQVAGTPVYWPREQITHYKFLNPATDVFSIAAVFYETLTGSRVREGFNEMFLQCRRRGRPPGISDYMRVIAANPPLPIRKRNGEIPKPVADVLDRALREAEVPADESRMRGVLEKLRYSDAGAFRSALGKALKKAGLKA